MDNYDDVMNEDLFEDDISLTFKDDGMSNEKREKFIEDLIREKNEYLVSMGYVIDGDELVEPDTKIVDGVLGFAVGDALGVPYEFLSRERISKRPCKDMVGFGSHRVSEGTWSDDTSMVIATMDSFIDNGLIDYDDIMCRFNIWLFDAKYTASDKVFDIGNTTRKAILKYKDGVDPVMCGGRNQLDNGNGSLMRMLPIAYYLNKNDFDFEQEVEIVNNVSSLTHGHEVSCLGCKIYCDYVKQLLNGVNRVEAIKNIGNLNYNGYYSDDSVDKYKRILNGDLFKLSRDDIKSSGYVVNTLEASLWSMLNSNSYEEAVLMGINLGGDTDTIGAITGSLAGIIYGKKNIPSRWISVLKRNDYLVDMCNKFSQSLNSKDVRRKK